MDKDRRESDRVKTGYMVKMWRSSSPSSRFVQAKLENISQGGCKLKMHDIQTGFAVGEPIVISFDLSDFNIPGSGTLKLNAHVRWTHTNGTELGCQFKEMEKKAEKIFAKVLEHLTHKA